MYNPTIQELEELWFNLRLILNDEYIFASHSNISAIDYNSYKNMWRCSFKTFYPINKNDIEVMIRLFKWME